MSPRKTRRGAKADGANETLSETISKKSKENSSPLSQRTIRTRGQLSKTIAQDSDADQSLDTTNSRRKTIQETPSGKSTRSRKRTVTENVGIIDDSSSVLDVTASTKKRTRRAKDNEVSSEQTMIQSRSTVDEPLIEKPRATRARAKTTKKDDSKSEEETPEVTSRKRRNSAIIKISPLVESVSTDGTPNDVPMSKEDTEVQQASDRISRLKDSSIAATSSPRSAVKRRARSVRARIEDFTPESSPITVNLSPHRSTKTPRKSPMNLGSPKSHADQSHRLAKTPRKLPVVAESPVGSEKSNDSSISGTPKKSPNNSSGNKFGEVGSSERKRNRKSKGKSPIKTPDTSPAKSVAVRKFSKSPKIVLRTPKVKTPKSTSPRVVTSKAKVSPLTKRFSKSPKKSRLSRSFAEPSDTTVETISPKLSKRKASRSRSPKKSATPVEKRENSRPPKLDSSNDASPRSARNASPLSTHVATIDVNRSPTVVLNKLSPADVIGTPESTRRSSSRRSNASADEPSKVTPIPTTSVEKLVSHVGASPRRAKSAVKKRTPITDLGTPLRPVASPRVNSAKHSVGKSIVVTASKSTPIMVRGTSGKVGENAPMLSSTPRERIRRSLNLSPGLGSTPVITVSSPINGPPVGSSTLIADVRATRSSRIEDVTNPLISEDDDSISLKAASRHSEQSGLDETFEVAKKTVLNVEEEEAAEQEEDKAGDGTYELIEPKTPVLRRKAAKRSLAEIDTSAEERIAKRTCRVRFASPQTNSEDNKLAVRNAGRARSATPGQRVDERRVAAGNATTGRKQGDSRRRSNSMTNVSLTKTPISNIKRRSTSTTTTNGLSASKTAQNASVNRLSKPRLVIHQLNKKTEIKTPVAKKAPNFAQIHEKKFAKMESLVDAKKRVVKRHLAINSQIPTSLSKVNTAARSKPKVSPKPAAPSVPINGAYNRYGFKLRKNDAIKIVSQKKQQTHVSETKQNENRMLLKGVRTNRRFDLIMKARNINQ